MKKILAIGLSIVFTLAVVLTCASCGKTVNRADTKKSEGVMTYGEYLAAPVDSEVVIEAYIQAKQLYSEQYGNTSLYLQDAEGGYFAYRVKCTAEEYAKFEIGKKVKITGTKTEWEGEVEFAEGTAKVELLEGKYVAEAKDATKVLANEEELIKLQNQFVSFKGLKVAASKDIDGNDVAYLYKWNGTGSEGDDLYFYVELDGKKYQFLVESDLCGADTEVYKAVKNLKVGDKINVEGFLYWYKGVNPHITGVKVVK